MHRFQISPQGPEFSAFAYGAWRLADDPAGASPARIRAKIDACLEAGITTFDHADIYGEYTVEGLFGRALQENPGLRDRMEIVSKAGINIPCPGRPGVHSNHYNATAAALEAAVDRSLRELRLSHLDLLLVHRPDWLTSAEETARGLQRVLDSGKVRHVGVSNYSTHQFALLQSYLGRPLATNQVELSLLHIDAIHDGTLDQCQAARSHPMAWSPLAGGRLLTGTDAAARRAQACLAKLAPLYHATPLQLALAWVAMLPSAPQVVIGTNQPERIREAAGAAGIILQREHWFELWQAAQGRDIP